MTEKLKFLDKLGREVRPGDTILHAINLGGSRSPGMLWARALEVLDNSNGERQSSPTKLRVIGIDEWFGKPRNLKSKPGELQFYWRVLLMDPKDVPEEVRQMLGSYKDK